MPRPGSAFTFSTNTNYAAGPAVGTPTKVVPTGGLIAEGWEPAVEPGAQNFNYLFNLIGQWVTWLNGNVWDGNIEFTGNIQIDGTLTLNDNLTMGANKNVIVSGTGKYKRGTRTRKIAPISGKLGGSAAAVSAGSPAYFDGRVQTTADGDTVVVTLVLNDDEQLTGVTADIYGDSVQTISMKVFKTQAFAGASQLGSTATSAASTTGQTLSSGALTETIVGGGTAGAQNLYVVSFHATGAASVKILIGSIEYTTIVP